MKIVFKRLDESFIENLNFMFIILFKYVFLGHPNTKAFIGHGGLLGLQEALYHGIPVIGIPFFGDQASNVEIFSKLNMLIKMEYEKISEDKLDKAIDSLLHDPSYK